MIVYRLGFLPRSDAAEAMAIIKNGKIKDGGNSGIGTEGCSVNWLSESVM